MSAQRRTATRRSATASGLKRQAALEKNGQTAEAAPSSAAPAAKPTPMAKPTSERAKTAVSARRNLWAKRTAGLRRMARDTWAETRKINWPDQQTTRNLTIVVIGISVVLGAFLGGLDYILFKLLQAIP